MKREGDRFDELMVRSPFLACVQLSLVLRPDETI